MQTRKSWALASHVKPLEKTNPQPIHDNVNPLWSGPPIIPFKALQSLATSEIDPLESSSRSDKPPYTLLRDEPTPRRGPGLRQKKVFNNDDQNDEAYIMAADTPEENAQDSSRQNTLIRSNSSSSTIERTPRKSSRLSHLEDAKPSFIVERHGPPPLPRSTNSPTLSGRDHKSEEQLTAETESKKDNDPSKQQNDHPQKVSTNNNKITKGTSRNVPEKQEGKIIKSSGRMALEQSLNRNLDDRFSAYFHNKFDYYSSDATKNNQLLPSQRPKTGSSEGNSRLSFRYMSQKNGNSLKVSDKQNRKVRFQSPIQTVHSFFETSPPELDPFANVNLRTSRRVFDLSQLSNRASFNRCYLKNII